jgi:multidrug transporter EmrE-like cation transporter
MTTYDWIGLAGMALILGAYFLLQAGRMRGHGLAYPLLNALGALGVLISLRYAFNLSAFVLELAWFAISIYGIVRALGRRRGA